MKILKLELLAFGPFTDLTLDLKLGDPGLHLIHGPNEAGKSSVLRAIQAALFGFPQQTTDNFLHDNKRLRVGAHLQNTSGDDLAFVRRKGRKETLLNPDHDQNAAFPDHVLDGYLGGITQETFQRIFGITHSELTSGGQDLAQLKGLVGESLFAASFGGASLAAVLADLESEAKDLYSAKRTAALRQAKTQYAEAVKQRREAEIPSSRWEKLQQELSAARTTQAELEASLKERRKSAHRLDRLRRAIKWLAERRRLIGEIESSGEVVLLPDTYSSEERSRCQADLSSLRRRIDQLQEELDGEQGLVARIAGIHVPEAVLNCEADILQADEDRGAILKAERDRAGTLSQEFESAQAQARDRLRDLGILDASLEEVAHLRIPADRRAAIRDLASDEKSVRQLPRQLEQKRREVAAAIKSQRQALAKLGPSPDTSPLEQLVERITKLGELDKDAEQVRAAMSISIREADRQVASLGLWSGSRSQLVGLELPLRETIDRFDDEFSRKTAARASVDAQLLATRSELDDVAQEIQSLQTIEQIPTEADLQSLRRARDQGWQLVRDSWEGRPDESAIGLFAGNDSLADAFAKSITAADHLSDRLRREAERVAQLAQRSARQSRLTEESARLSEQLAVADRELEQLDLEWRAHWQPAGIDQPLSPREMRAWLDRHSAIQQLSTEIDQQQAGLGRIEEKIEAARGELTDALSRLDEAIVDDSLTGMLQQARSVIDQSGQTSRVRLDHERELDRLELEEEATRAAIEQAGETLQGWSLKWGAAMEQLGCSADATAGQANERMSMLEELFLLIDKVEDRQRRIRSIGRDAELFGRAVDQLVTRLAPELASASAADQARRLREKLDQARQDHVRLEDLEQQREACQAELETIVKQEAVLTETLASLCHAAGVSDADELAGVERASDELLSRRKRLQEVEQQLHDLSGGEAMDHLEAELADRDIDELTAEIDALNDQTVELEQQRDQSVARIRELENESAAVDGSSTAAEADERALSILAQMQTAAERYMRLRLAASMLRLQIEKHRADNQDPVLTRASALFARLTCGEFAGIKVDYNQDDQPIIVGMRKSGTGLLQVSGMSTGTRDQLYLALRLAYVERRLVQQEPMPFVVDDILIHFDDRRAVATLEVLTELATQTQVIFFTHHEHLAQLAESRLTSNELFVHHLDRTGHPGAVGSSSGRRPK